MTKSSSGFSCHLIKTFDGCTEKQTAQALAQVFVFVKTQTNKTSNRSTRADKNIVVGDTFSATESFTDAASHIFAHVSVVITLAMQIHQM